MRFPPSPSHPITRIHHPYVTSSSTLLPSSSSSSSSSSHPSSSSMIDNEIERLQRIEFRQHIDKMDIGVTLYGVRTTYRTAFRGLYVVLGILVFMMAQTSLFNNVTNLTNVI
eukprot:TRINITY_DN1974_c4_g1_i1.p1 TRINITY_DN1974_c4_g1~~TRINITY_DN1974_c4_g1_i1.p1  ORF type:complete len:123 (+),score=38.03 TRINITY_DN1974_c4_g1_i1:36-371(+)